MIVPAIIIVSVSVAVPIITLPRLFRRHDKEVLNRLGGRDNVIKMARENEAIINNVKKQLGVEH